MKTDSVLRNMDDDSIVNISSNKIDRRELHRYIFGQKASVIPLAVNNTRLTDYQIINISANGLSLECSMSFSISESLKFTLVLDGKKEIVCSGRIIWGYKKDGRYYYGIHFYYFQDGSDSRMYHDFVNSVINKIDIDDRRKGERRRDDVSEEISNKRKFERRISKSFFVKCLKYDRADKLIRDNNYYFFRSRDNGSDRQVVMNGVEKLNFGSNNYLGLSTHPEVKEAAIRAIEHYGIGTCGSRMLSGTNDIHLELEQRILGYKKGEDCFVFPTGYSANVGVLSGILCPDDIVIMDSKSHASIIDGCILARSKFTTFRHNDMKDLEKTLKRYPQEDPKIVLTEGVFSMDGDIGRIDAICELGKQYNAAVFVDDAHATGVIGKTGRGTDELFGVQGKIDMITGTLSKAFGALGGFVIANKKITGYLRHNSRSSIFSASLPPAICASVIKAIDIAERDPSIHEKLWDNIRYFREKVLSLGYDIGKTESAIFPLIIKDELKTYKLTGMLDRNGIYASPVAYPAVKKSESRLRISLIATHTRADLDYLLDQLKTAGTQLGII